MFRPYFFYIFSLLLFLSARADTIPLSNIKLDTIRPRLEHISNKSPLASLTSGDKVQAGDFEIEIVEANGGGGTFNGKGFMRVPYFKLAKIAVTFQGAKINTDRRLIDGYFQAVVDWENGSIANVGKMIKDNLQAIQGGISGSTGAGAIVVQNQYNGVIASVNDIQVSSSSVSIGGQSFPRTPNATTLIQDKEGNTYGVGEEGEKVQVGKQTKDKIPGSSGGYSGGSDNTPLAQGKGNITFSANATQKYGFDFIDNEKLLKNYDKISGTPIPWKSVKTAGMDKVSYTGSASTGTLKFRTKAGFEYKPENGVLNILGTKHGDVQEIYAIAYQDSANQHFIGKLQAMTLNSVKNTVFVIPTHPSQTLDKAKIQAYLDMVYDQAVMHWDVEIISQYKPTITLGDNGLDIGEDENRKDLTEEMKALRDDFKKQGLVQKDDAQTYYVFLVDKFSEASIDGYFPQSKLYGFVKYSTSEPTLHKTLAHELGHGAGNLEHPFVQYGTSVGATPLLMDYSSGVQLSKFDWGQLHNQGIRTGWKDEVGDNAWISANLPCNKTQKSNGGYIIHDEVLNAQFFQQSYNKKCDKVFSQNNQSYQYSEYKPDAKRTILRWCDYDKRQGELEEVYSLIYNDTTTFFVKHKLGKPLETDFYYITQRECTDDWKKMYLDKGKSSGEALSDAGQKFMFYSMVAILSGGVGLESATLELVVQSAFEGTIESLVETDIRDDNKIQKIFENSVKNTVRNVLVGKSFEYVLKGSIVLSKTAIDDIRQLYNLRKTNPNIIRDNVANIRKNIYKEAETKIEIPSSEVGKVGVTTGKEITNSVKRLINNNSNSINIVWKNLDETNIIWSTPNSNVLSTAKTFANEKGATLYDAVLPNNYYVKFDLNDGRILLGKTDGTYNAFAVLNDADLGAFKSSVLKVSDDVFNTKLSQLLSTNADKLKVLSGTVSKPLTIAGKSVTLSSSKVNTMLGRFRPDVANLFDELGSFKNVGLGESKGGINILKKPDHYYDAATWWSAYNKPWLDKAIGRGDDIYLATIPTKADDLVDATGKLKGAYAEELNHLATKNYKPKNITDVEFQVIKNWLGIRHTNWVHVTDITNKVLAKKTSRFDC